MLYREKCNFFYRSDRKILPIMNTNSMVRKDLQKVLRYVVKPYPYTGCGRSRNQKEKICHTTAGNSVCYLRIIRSAIDVFRNTRSVHEPRSISVTQSRPSLNMTIRSTFSFSAILTIMFAGVPRSIIFVQ